MMGYGWHDGGWGWGTWLFMIVMMVLFWSVIVALAVMAFRHLRGLPPYPHTSSPAGHGPEAAMRILEERFARGEIDAEEFSRRRELLKGQ